MWMLQLLPLIFLYHIIYLLYIYYCIGGFWGTKDCMCMFYCDVTHSTFTLRVSSWNCLTVFSREFGFRGAENVMHIPAVMLGLRAVWWFCKQVSTLTPVLAHRWLVHGRVYDAFWLNTGWPWRHLVTCITASNTRYQKEGSKHLQTCQNLQNVIQDAICL